MSPHDRRRLEHILDQIDRIRRYTAGGRAAYDRDQMAQDAVARCLTVIAEAAGAVSDQTRAGLASLPPTSVRGQRNILVHEYWRIDHDLVWATIERDLPPLADEIRHSLDAGSE